MLRYPCFTVISLPFNFVVSLSNLFISVSFFFNLFTEQVRKGQEQKEVRADEGLAPCAVFEQHEFHIGPTYPIQTKREHFLTRFKNINHKQGI